MDPQPTIVIDHHRAIELLNQVIAGNEDFVYPKRVGDMGVEYCDYVRDGQPSCIVGKALHLAGVSVEMLKRVENNRPLQKFWNDDLNRYVDFGEMLGIQLTWLAAIAFEEAQRIQDDGSSWGVAVRKATNYVTEKASSPQP
ncbi:MAG TPA: hypothetical protein VHK27_03210 [Gammaproteobacteria bacterium]|nr:hypothetical protein [Gammaproteobacteria bacterium]